MHTFLFMSSHWFGESHPVILEFRVNTSWPWHPGASLLSGPKCSDLHPCRFLGQIDWHVLTSNWVLALCVCRSIFASTGLSAESVSHSAVFFSHNKSANSTFCYDLSAKRTIDGIDWKDIFGCKYELRSWITNGNRIQSSEKSNHAYYVKCFDLEGKKNVEDQICNSTRKQRRPFILDYLYAYAVSLLSIISFIFWDMIMFTLFISLITAFYNLPSVHA